MKSRKLACVLIISVVIVCFACTLPLCADEKKIVWTGQSSYPAGLPQLFAPAPHFATIVEQLTDGRLIVSFMENIFAFGP